MGSFRLLSHRFLLCSPLNNQCELFAHCSVEHICVAEQMQTVEPLCSNAHKEHLDVD